MWTEEQKKRQKELYYARKEAGLCVGCGGKKELKDRVYCLNCLDAQSVSHMMFYARMSPERKEEINKQRREHAKIRYQHRKDAGICVDCGKPAVSGKTRCKRCLALLADRQKKIYSRKTRKAEWIANGLCCLCGKERKPGYKLCEEHWKKTCENAKKQRRKK